MIVTVYTHPEFERKFKQYKKSTTRWYLTIVHFLTVLKRIHFKYFRATLSLRAGGDDSSKMVYCFLQNSHTRR